MQRITHITMFLTATALLTACSGGERTTANSPPETSDPGSGPAPVAFRVFDGYLAPPEVSSDRDFDLIPDAEDEFPDEAAVQASAYGASAFVIDRVFTATVDGDIEAAATFSGPLTIVGRGFDKGTGQPQLLFTGGIEPVAVRPERIDANTWRALPPPGSNAVFAVVGRERSNSFAFHALSAAAPKLFRNESALTNGSIIEISGENLDTVRAARLGNDVVTILDSSGDQLRLLLPAAPTSNRLQVSGNGVVSNSIELELQHAVRIVLEPGLALPAGAGVSGRYKATPFAVGSSGSPALAVDGDKPIAFYLDVDGEPIGLGTIAWPDRSDVSVSSETTLMSELWVHRMSLPMRAGMDWRDQRAFLENAMRLPESQAYIDSHESWLATGSSWDRSAARQAVMNAIAADTTPEAMAVQQAALIASDALDDIIAFTISPSTVEQPDFGSNTTVDQPRVDIPGNNYALFEVAGHDETRLLLSICDYPPNTPVPAGLWPSDLCAQNSTNVFASFSVYQPHRKTWGIPFRKNAADLRRRHIDGPASTEPAQEGAAYLTDNRSGGAGQAALCRMQSCYVEVLTSGFGNGYKDTGLTAEERRVVHDLRLKWVFEGMIIPIISDKLGLANLPACLPGEMYANTNFYPKIEALVEAIRAGRASHTITQAKQLFNDIVGEWLRSILTGTLAEEGNVVECVAAETLLSKSAIKDAFVDLFDFASDLNDALFVGGLILTPEKFTFKVQYRAEVADIVADIAPDGVTPMVDTVNGLYFGAAQAPRLLTITGTWIADETAADPAQRYYPTIIFRDTAGNTQRLPIDASHYVDTGNVAWRQLDIPLPSLVDDSLGVDLNRLVPGMISVEVEFNHAIFPGYPGSLLRVPSPVRFMLKNKPRLVGFTPPSGPPGSTMTANGTSLETLGSNPKVVLYRNAGNGNFNCASADQNASEPTRIEVRPADVLATADGKEIHFLMPDNVDLNAFYFTCVSPAGGSSVETITSPIPFFTLDLNLPNTGLVTFSDFGRVKDDTIRLSVLDQFGMPISFTDNSCAPADPNCVRDVTLVFEVPNPEDNKHVRTLYWDNNVLMNSYGINAQSLLLECIDSGSDTTCTYGIGATNVLLDNLDTNQGGVISDAGKFSPGNANKIEYLIVYP